MAVEKYDPYSLKGPEKNAADDTNLAVSIAAGIGSGLVKIPLGLTSVAAEIYDAVRGEGLSVEDSAVARLEQFLDNSVVGDVVQGLEDRARATAAGILGRAAVPLAGGLAAGRLGSNIGGAVGRGAIGLGGYGLTGGEGMGGAALPPGMGPYGMVSPTGSPIDVLNPLGLEAGRRTRTVKDAEALRDAQNIVLPTVRKFSEQAKKDDFERDMAAEGIKQNILMNRNLTEGLAQATRQMGTTAAEQAGAALTRQYNY